MKNITLFLSLVILLYSVKSLACETTLTLGVGSDWKPYYFEEQGQPKGADIQYIKSILAEANICLAYSKIPSSMRAVVEIEKGNIDFLLGASYSPERNKFARFSTPYRPERVRIFWIENKYPHLTDATLSGLIEAGLSGVSNRGSYLGSHQGKMKINPSIHKVTTIEQRMKMLAYGRVDFVIEDEVAGLNYLHQHALDHIELHPYVVFENEVSLMFSRKSVPKQLVDKINVVLDKSKINYKDILSLYMTSSDYSGSAK